MRVKCIYNIGRKYLTVGKIYDVIKEDKFCYWITDDNGLVECQFYKICFKTLSEIRNETINKLLEDES